MLNSQSSGASDQDRIRHLEASIRQLRRTIRFLAITAALGIAGIVCLGGAATQEEGLLARIDRLEAMSPEPGTLVCKRLYVIPEPSKFSDPNVQRLLTIARQEEETFVLVASPVTGGMSENRYAKLAASPENAHFRLEYNHPGSAQDGMYDIVTTREHAEVMHSPAPSVVPAFQPIEPGAEVSAR